MLKEVILAIVLTLLFSVGVGVLFVRTIMEMLELLFTNTPSPRDHRGSENRGA